MTKLTARNSAILAHIKENYTAQLFRVCSNLANSQSEIAAINFLAELFNGPTVQELSVIYGPLVAASNHLTTEQKIAFAEQYAGPDNRPVQGPLRMIDLWALRSVASAESSGKPHRFGGITFFMLEDQRLIEYVEPRTFEGICILTAAGLAYLSDERTDSTSLSREHVVMSEECAYWRGLYGDPGPFEDKYDEICYWRKTRGMPPIGALPSLDSLINDQIDQNPPLAVELGLTRR